MKKLFALMAVVLLVVSCASIPGSRWNHEKKATDYFDTTYGREHMREDVLSGNLTLDMTKQEAKWALYIDNHNYIIQEKEGVYKEYSGAYWIVGTMLEDYEAGYSIFRPEFIVFFEFDLVTGWQDM